MRLPATIYRHGYSRDRRGSNASVSPHFLLPIPRWEVKPITIHTLPRTVFPPITLEGGYDKVHIPRSRGFGLICPASTQPRPGLGIPRRLAGKKGQRGIGLRVISPSRPRRHHSVQGWPAIPRARRYSHPHRDRQNLTSRHPGTLASSCPIKRAGQGSTRQGRPQARSHKSTSQAITLVLSHFT
jgi:hypothetical protein